MMGKRPLKYLFDLDGTLTRIELLPLFASHFGAPKEIYRYTDMVVRGEISFQEGFSHRVRLLGHIPPEDIAEVAKTAPMNEKVIKWIHNNFENCEVVTGNLDCWVAPLLDKWGLKGITSTARIEGTRVGIENVVDKAARVRHWKQQDSVTFVGDGANDLGAIEHADVGIAYGGVHLPAQVLLEVSDVIVFNEEALCSVLSQL